MSRSFAAASLNYLANTSLAPLAAAPLSISALINPLGAAANRAVFCMVDPVSAARHLLYLTSGDQGAIFVHDGSTFGQSTTGATTVPVGTWAQLGCAVASASSRQIVLNGVLGAADTTALTMAAMGRTYVGAYFDGASLVAGFYYSGIVADIGVWNVVLTQDEWTSLAAGASARLIRPQNLVSYWPLFARVTSEEDWIQGITISNALTPPLSSDNPRLVYPGHRRRISPPPSAAPVTYSPPYKIFTYPVYP